VDFSYLKAYFQSWTTADNVKKKGKRDYGRIEIYMKFQEYLRNKIDDAL